MNFRLLTVLKGLLHWCLPEHLKEPVCGDLEEEYRTKIVLEKGRFSANLWLLQQTLRTCGHYVLTPVHLLVLCISTFSLALFMVLATAIIWLSDMDQAQLSQLGQVFWQKWLTGQTHLVFFEPAYRQFLTEPWDNQVNLLMWVDIRAFCYSVLCLLLLTKWQRFKQLGAAGFTAVSLLLMMTPYIIGSAVFVFSHIELTESGPIVATMWLTLLYMLLPVSYQISSRLLASRLHMQQN